MSDRAPTALTNELGRETSPYLRQHADNPVHWQPWGERAFELARKLERPVLLSIGYSACHWCHVMAHESFENEELAAVLNEHFVNVKVDREERPDVDDVYMTACHLLTGSGGWPLTLALTPDREVFFAATYIPRETRNGRMGMLELAPRLAELWRGERNRVAEAAARITRAMREMDQPGEDATLPGDAVFSRAARRLTVNYDAEHGGFGSAPKFPSPQVLLFLLREEARTGDRALGEMARNTLAAMRRGGVFDQLGFGLHRYSTDERWLLPHFEKMLHDQALFALAALEAHQSGGDAAFAQIAREVFEYVLRDLTAPDGTFYTAEDADSEGEEGRYYVWTMQEMREILSREDAALAERVFGLEAEGNYHDEATAKRTGANVLHLPLPVRVMAGHEGMEQSELERRMERIRSALLERRGTRTRPGLDDKVLTDMNGLMIAALARGGRVLAEPAYLRAAERAAESLLARHASPAGLLHCLRGDQDAVPGLLDDYSFLIWGLLELHEAGQHHGHLGRALELAEEMIERFEEPEGGGFHVSAADGGLPVRRRTAYDGAMPSGNSVAAYVLLRLAALGGDDGLRESGLGTLRAFAENLERHPEGFAFLLCALRHGLHPPDRVALPRESAARSTFLHEIGSAFLPDAVFTAQEQGQDTGALVCAQGACLQPVNSPKELLRLLADRGLRADRT